MLFDNVWETCITKMIWIAFTKVYFDEKLNIAHTLGLTEIILYLTPFSHDFRLSVWNPVARLYFVYLDDSWPDGLAFWSLRLYSGTTALINCNWKLLSLLMYVHSSRNIELVLFNWRLSTFTFRCVSLQKKRRKELKVIKALVFGRAALHTTGRRWGVTLLDRSVLWQI